MGFLSKIVGGITKAIGGGGLGGLGDMFKKGLGGLIKPFADKISGFLNKSPFANIVNKFIGFAAKIGPKMAEGGGPLGMLGGLLSKVGGLGSLANIAQTLLGKLGGSSALSQLGLGNLTEMFAQRQAQMMQNIR